MLKKSLFSSTVLALVSALAMSGIAQAGVFNFTGTLNYHNDVVRFDFSLFSDATDVRIWTDSFQDGANFDPITALWEEDGTLIAENDDDSTINPATQTVWDSGISLPSLTAGNYIFTVTSFDNFALGTNLADGFSYDGETPIPINEWWVEAPGNWSVWFDGVDNVTPPSVPEPTSLALLGLGLAGLGFMRRRRT